MRGRNSRRRSKRCRMASPATIPSTHLQRRQHCRRLSRRNSLRAQARRKGGKPEQLVPSQRASASRNRTGCFLRKKDRKKKTRWRKAIGSGQIGLGILQGHPEAPAFLPAGREI